MEISRENMRGILEYGFFSFYGMMKLIDWLVVGSPTEKTMRALVIFHIALINAFRSINCIKSEF